MRDLAMPETLERRWVLTGELVGLDPSPFRWHDAAESSSSDTQSSPEGMVVRQAAVPALAGAVAAAANSAPTEIHISNRFLQEKRPVGTEVGVLSASDPDPGDIITFSLALGGLDNAAFEIVGTSLRTKSVFDLNTRANYTIRIRAEDLGGLAIERDLALQVTERWRVVKDINDAPGTGDAGIEHLTAVGNLVYFSAETPNEGRELWVSDGTPEGTRIVKDIATGTHSSTPHQLVNHNGGLAFLVRNDGLVSSYSFLTDSVLFTTEGNASSMQ